MDLINALHDEIDLQEDLRLRARAIVEETIKNNIDVILKKTGDFNEILTTLALLVENELADLTTEAVKQSAKLAQRRQEVNV
jgi:hypothetical protein